MKMLIAIIYFSSFSIFAIDEVNIPHYQYYPKTSIVSYEGEILDFYSVKNDYGEFSNFALFPFELDGKLWPSSEHYYQAQKFFDPDLQEQIRNAKTPYEAAKLARDPNMPLREDWDQVRDGIMLKALHAKFSSYKVLRDLLLSTNSAHLYEHTKNDCYWADCGDRTGTNMLGQELMMVRDELKNNLEVELISK